MNPLGLTIPEIQKTYADEADPSVFRDLLEMEKKGKKRKVLKRWLRERIKTLEAPKFESFEDDGSPTTESNRKFTDPVELTRELISRARTPPKDKITGIPIVG